MNTFEFFWGGGGDESPRWGHSPRMRSGGSGDEGSLPNSFGWEFILFIKTHFYGGALTSHFMEEHSSPTSIFPVFMMKMETCSAPLAFVWGIHRWQSRRRWFETPSRSLWRHCNVVPNSDPVISGQPWDLSACRASLLSNFELVKRVKLGGSVHYGRDGLKFGTLLYPDYHSLKLTIFCTQWQFKFVVSDHP